MGRSGLLVIVEVMFVRNESRWWWACAGPTEDRDRVVTRDSGQSRHPSRGTSSRMQMADDGLVQSSTGICASVFFKFDALLFTE